MAQTQLPDLFLYPGGQVPGGLQDVILEGEEEDTTENGSTSQTGGEGRNDPGEEALRQEGQHQLQGPEAGHQVGGDQLEGLGQGGEGQQTRDSQTWRQLISKYDVGAASSHLTDIQGPVLPGDVKDVSRQDL